MEGFTKSSVSFLRDFRCIQKSVGGENCVGFPEMGPKNLFEVVLSVLASWMAEDQNL